MDGVDDEGEGGGCPMSRRRFLQAIGLGAAATVTAPVLGAAVPAAAAAGAGVAGTSPAARYEANFGRMFAKLPAFATPSQGLTEALIDLGRPGGVLDAQDDLSAGPVQLIVNPALSVNNPDHPHQSAGVTFVGQFIDHDVTFDAGSPLGVAADVRKSVNSRTPMLDLDSVYGAGPTASPHLYDYADKSKFHYESGGRFEDVPRGAGMRAVISDPRNDEHVILSGLQCAFMKFHNEVVDRIARPGRSDPTTFATARQITTWHYQWMVVNEFLPQFVGQAMVDDVLARGRRHYRPDVAVMPVEFQGAAYRFGHSMVRPSYRANLAGNDDGSAFFGFIFDADATPSDDPDDLVGGFRAPRRFVGWQTFFDFGDGAARPHKRIDTKLSTPLFNLPMSAIASGDNPVVLPQRTLLRHLTWSLPSGQAIARAMGAPALAAGDLPELAAYGLGLESSSPLWYYVLKEAELVEDGLHLGPVGGRIVAEVLLGLLQLDPTSYLNARPAWRPTLPDRHGVVAGDFRMVDFLTFAGVDPTSRGQ
ncbi:MAG TPA: heme peroxidase family protein [Acidimicrobiales bacterium]|nr:heme peroxidase family protein [Acidimicrobiales bacterium]